MWRVTQVSGQWVSKHRTGYWKGPTTICCKTVRRCHQLMASSGTKMLSRLERGTQLDTGEQNHTDICVWSHWVCTWHARVRQASGAQYASAASDPVELPCTTDHTNCRVQHSLQLVGDDLWSPSEDNVTASHTRCWAFVIINIFKTL